VVYDSPAAVRQPWPDTVLADRIRIGPPGVREPDAEPDAIEPDASELYATQLYATELYATESDVAGESDDPETRAEDPAATAVEDSGDLDGVLTDQEGEPGAASSPNRSEAGESGVSEQSATEHDAPGQSAADQDTTGEADTDRGAPGEAGTDAVSGAALPAGSRPWR
jgi:hypothetical protein